MTKMAKEVKEMLKETYPYRIEMHAHTHPVSYCAEVTPEEVIDLYADLGYHAVVITNHMALTYSMFEEEGTKEELIDKYIGAYVQAKAAAEKRGMVAILGAEIRFDENNNDYLLYGVDKSILMEAYDLLSEGLAAYRKKADLSKTVLLQAHPFRQRMELMDASLLDGVETFNMHPGHNGAVGLAVKYAKENQLPITIAGSDFHHKDKNHEGVSALRTKELPKDSFALAEILRSGDYVLEIGGEAIVLP